MALLGRQERRQGRRGGGRRSGRPRPAPGRTQRRGDHTSGRRPGAAAPREGGRRRRRQGHARRARARRDRPRRSRPPGARRDAASATTACWSSATSSARATSRCRSSPTRHGTVLHLGERECSLQRRHQKVIEEAPSPVVDAALRERMGAAAVASPRACGYVGAGTVEFIADGTTRRVLLPRDEHAAAGRAPGDRAGHGARPRRAAAARRRGRAAAARPGGRRGCAVTPIEARLYAEDPGDRLPARDRAGRGLPRARLECASTAASAPGCEVGTDYDPMLAKIIAHGPDRPTALGRLARALDETSQSSGRVRTPPISARCSLGRSCGQASSTPGCSSASVTTSRPAQPDPDLSACGLDRTAGQFGRRRSLGPGDGWRPSGSAEVRALLDGPDGEIEAFTQPGASGWWAVGADRARLEPDGLVGRARGRKRAPDRSVLRGRAVWLVDAGRSGPLGPDPQPCRSSGRGGGSLEAPMPGVVLEVSATGVPPRSEGDVLLVLESMKMEMPRSAPGTGSSMTSSSSPATMSRRASCSSPSLPKPRRTHGDRMSSLVTHARPGSRDSQRTKQSTAGSRPISASGSPA